MISLWLKAEGDEFCSFQNTRVVSTLYCDCAESSKLITFVVFLSWLMDNFKLAMSDKMDNTGFCAVIHDLRLKRTFKEMYELHAGKKWDAHFKIGGKKRLH